MVDSISEKHIVEYTTILYDMRASVAGLPASACMLTPCTADDISKNIIFNPYNEYDMRASDAGLPASACRLTPFTADDISKNLIKSIINELEKKKIYNNSILKELFLTDNIFIKEEFCKKIIDNYNNELIYTNYINKNVMYLYLFVDESKENLKEKYLLKKGFSNMIDFREYQLIKEYNVKLYLLGLYEIKNENYEKIYHKFYHLKNLKIKLTYKKKTKNKDISGNYIMKIISKDEIYEVSPKSIYEFFMYGIYMQNFIESNNIELKKIECEIEKEKTKQIELQEKTKQEEEKTKQEEEKTKQEEEKTKQKIEDTNQEKLKLKQLELQIKLKKLELNNL
jgi:hypothetical protein